jgi:hypothetical protein
MNFVVFKGKASKLLISFLLLAAILAVNLPANSAKAEVIYATEVDNLQVNSPIVVTFDKAIDAALLPAPGSDIQLLDITDSLNPVAVGISLQAVGNKLKVIPNSNLASNTEYRLEIKKDAVKDDSGDPVFDEAVLKRTFSTNSISFLELMMGGGQITNLINDFTPRQMIVTAPIRYVDKMEIIHRQRGMNGTDTESVTNLNISLDDPTNKVVRIVVNANGQEKEINYLNINVPSDSYDFAFAGLPDSGYDIKVDIYDSVDEEEDQNLLDSRVIKVTPSPNKATTTLKVADSFKMAGKSFTLMQLLQKDKDMQKLLDENSLEDLKVQVVEE